MANWSIPFDVLAKRTNQRIETVVRAFALEVFTRVVIRSPVDTGRFRANWNVSYGAMDTTVTNKVDPSGGSTKTQIKNAVFSYPMGGIFYLSNSLPYATTIEYGGYPNPAKRGSKKRKETEYTIHTVGGYSMQAPQGMVRLTAREFAEAVEIALKSNDII